jgi:serine protease Do
MGFANRAHGGRRIFRNRLAVSAGIATATLVLASACLTRGAGDGAAADISALDRAELDQQLPDRGAPVAPTDTLDAAHLQTRFQQIADNASRGVVAISASFAAADNDAALRSADLNPDKLEAQLDRTTRTVGSGMILSADGFILTNQHVVAEGQQLWVTTDDHKVYPAMIVGADPRADLAVIKIPGEGFHPVALGQSPVHRGQWTIAIGNPLGLAEAGEMAFSVGVVSATERSLAHLSNQENRIYANLIQTTAQINPGNSGGPLFDLDGRVIGINAAVILPQKQTNGIGFAMPVTPELLDEVALLRQGREIEYGYIGVNVSTPSARERELAHVPANEGVTIDSVDPDERAAGVLEPGDIVYGFDGVAISDCDQFVRVVGRASVIERQISIAASRNGQLLTLSIKPRKRTLSPMAVCRDTQRLRWRGLLLGPIPVGSTCGETQASDSTAATGVMVFGIDDDSPARKDGLLVGSVITAIGNHPISDLLTLQKLINDTPLEADRITARPPAVVTSSAR